MTPLEILIAARALIETPERWTKGRANREVNGQLCHCWMGAVWDAAGTSVGQMIATIEGIMHEVALERGFINPVDLNDDPATTHAMILSAFDAAIEKAKRS